MIRSLLLIVPLLALSLGAGCQKNASLPVSGRVVQNQQPVPYSVVRFTPAAGASGSTVTMVAEEGLFSSAAADAPITPGENQVIVIVPATGEEALPQEFAFTINISDQGDSEVVLDLAQAKKQ